MATTIVLKNSVTTTNTPSSLAQGEVAINVTDKKVWVGNAATTPVQIVNGGPDGVFTSVTDSGLTNTRLTYAGAGGLLKDSANITTDGTTITAAFSGAHNGTVGATTPAAGVFTSVTSTNTRSSFTAPSDVYAIAVSYNSSGGKFYIGATNSATPDMIFSGVSGGEIARLTNTGAFAVGTTGALSNSGTLLSGGRFSGGGFICHDGITGTNWGNTFNLYWTGSSTQLWIDSTNTGTIALVSDYRVKKLVETQTLSALNRIENIRPITYTFKDYEKFSWKADGVAREGFIAHELAEIIPSAVEGEKDAENQVQSLKLDALCSVMVKAIQELNAKVDAQAVEIAALKGI